MAARRDGAETRVFQVVADADAAKTIGDPMVSKCPPLWDHNILFGIRVIIDGVREQGTFGRQRETKRRSSPHQSGSVVPPGKQSLVKAYIENGVSAVIDSVDGLAESLRDGCDVVYGTSVPVAHRRDA